MGEKKEEKKKKKKKLISYRWLLMGISNSLPAKEPPPISTRAISVRTRFNAQQGSQTQDTQNACVYAWRAVPYSPVISTYGHAMCCVDDKLVMVGGIRKVIQKKKTYI